MHACAAAIMGRVRRAAAVEAAAIATACAADANVMN